MRIIQENLFRSPKVVAASLLGVLVVTVSVGLHQLHDHITATVLKNMLTINNSVQRALHQQISSEVISATQIIDNAEIHQALIIALDHNTHRVEQRHRLRMLLAGRIFPQHYGGFYLIGKNQTIIASMKERDTGMNVPEASAQSIKRLEEGEPSVITHAFMFHKRIHMWLLKPIKDSAGGMIGYFALELGDEHQFSMTTLTTGISYSSGETYLVDQQGRMLSESRFRDDLVRIGRLENTQSSVLNINVVNPGMNLLQQSESKFNLSSYTLTKAVQQAITTHKVGWNIEGYRDYRGVMSLGVWQWDDYLNAAIITEMNDSEAMLDYVYVRNLLFIVLFVVLLACLVSVVEHGRLRMRLQREKNEHKNLLLNSTAEAIYGIDLQGNCSFVNETFKTMMGYSEAELLGKNMHALIHYADSDGNPYPESSCPIIHVPIDCQHIHKKKEVFWHKAGHSIKVEYWAQPLFENDQVQGSVVSFLARDERKHLKKYSHTSQQAGFPVVRKADADRAVLNTVDPRQETPPTHVQAEQESDTGIVLVVDDDELVREVACVMLEELGFKTMIAEDGQQALDIYRDYQDTIVCVMTDLTMPRMDGKELLVQLQSIDATCRVIVCSGYSSDYASQQFMYQSVSAFLQKPYSKDDLSDVVHSVLGMES